MRNKGDFTGYLIPIVSDYNKEILEQLEIIEKRLQFVQSNAFSTAYAAQSRNISYDEETGRIASVSYSKREEYNFAGSFLIKLAWNGTFTLWCRNHVELVSKTENLSFASFLGCASEENIETLKAFWENPRDRKKTA